MKKILALAASTGIILGGTAIISPAAQADTPGCVTRAEYRSVHKGMRKARVHAIFDTTGHRQVIASGGGHTTEIRDYRTCSPYSVVVVSYTDGRVDGKNAVWVS